MTEAIDLKLFLERQFIWSLQTFGPADLPYDEECRAKIKSDGIFYGAGCVDHIKKELGEIASCHGKDVEEWIDVVILALDGAMRSGYSPQEIIDALTFKAEKNRRRTWPDWRTQEPGKAIEHVRDAE
jgi:hypothetical protein